MPIRPTTKQAQTGFLLALSGLLVIATIHLVSSDTGIHHVPLSDDVFQREHTLVKPYQGAGMTIPNWEFFGHTIVTSNYIRLTQDAQSRQGGIWNVKPYQSRYWQIEVSFRVHGHGSELYGDGFALWYVKEPPKGGPVFGNRDYFSGLAIVFDTYANNNAGHHQYPYISVMVNNGTLHYDHESDGIHSELAGCERKFRGLEHDARIFVQYYNEVLTIKTDIENTGIWTNCAVIQHVYLPSHYYFGITAATGDLSDNHDILAIKMSQLSHVVPAPDPRAEPDLPRADYTIPDRDRPKESPNGMSTLRKFFLIVSVFVAVIAVAGFGYFLYNSKKSSARKRFY